MLILVWLGFNFPALTGRVLFPVDFDRRILPESALADHPPPANPLEGDAETLYYPLRSYLGERLRQGDIPLWDPHRFAGTPFAANSQTGVWYPPNWFFAWGNPVQTYSLILVVSRLGGLLLFYWFLRRLSIHPMAAAAGSVVFTASGFLMAWGLHITFPSSAIWLPLALGGITVSFQGEPRKGIPLAALGLALAILGGHPQVALFVWVAAVLWALPYVIARAFHRRSQGAMSMLRSVAGGSIMTGAAFALGAGLAAPQVLSALEFSDATIRGVQPYEGQLAIALPLRAAFTLLLPDRFGNPTDGNDVLAVNYVESAFYAGIFVIVLAALGLWYRRDRIGVGFTLIGAVGALAAFGTPVYGLLYILVPTMNRFRAPGRLVMLLDVGLAGLAALGLDRIIREPKRFLVPVLVVSGGILLALLASVTIFFPDLVSGSYLWPKVGLGAGFLVGGTGLAIALTRARRWSLVVAGGIVALVALDLWNFGWRFHPFRPSVPVYRAESGVEFLAAQPGRPRIVRIGRYWIAHNAALVHGLYDVQGYDNFISRRYIDLVSLIEDQHVNAAGFNVVYNLSSPDRLQSPIADLLGIRLVLAAPDQDGLGPPLVASAFGVYERPSAFPPAFLAPCWEGIPSGRAPARLSVMTAEELRSVALVDRETDSPALPEPEGPCRPDGTATMESLEPERVEIATDAPRQEMLVLTDVWDQGWKVTVDGSPAAVLRVDHTLRGVLVPSGDHRIEFTYRPEWLVPSYLIAAVSVVAIVVLATGLANRLLSRPAGPDQPSGSARNRYTRSISGSQFE